MGYSETNLITLITKRDNAKKLLDYVTDLVKTAGFGSAEENLRDLSLKVNEKGEYSCISYDNGYPLGTTKLEPEAVRQIFPNCTALKYSWGEGLGDFVIKLNGILIAKAEDEPDFIVARDYHEGATADQNIFLGTEKVTFSWPFKVPDNLSAEAIKNGNPDKWYWANYDVPPKSVASHPEGELWTRISAFLQTHDDFSSIDFGQEFYESIVIEITENRVSVEDLLTRYRIPIVEHSAVDTTKIPTESNPLPSPSPTETASDGEDDALPF